MSVCRTIVRTLILAFFAINAWNRFQSATASTEGFKASYGNFEHTIKSRFGFDLPQYVNSASLKPFAFQIVYYGSLAQLALSILGVFWGCSSSLAGLLFFVHQLIALNLLKTDLKNTQELETLALSVALFISALAIGCCGNACRTKCTRGDKKAEAESHAQAGNKRRH